MSVYCTIASSTLAATFGLYSQSPELYRRRAKANSDGPGRTGAAAEADTIDWAGRCAKTVRPAAARPVLTPISLRNARRDGSQSLIQTMLSGEQPDAKPPVIATA